MRTRSCACTAMRLAYPPPPRAREAQVVCTRSPARKPWLSVTTTPAASKPGVKGKAGTDRLPSRWKRSRRLTVVAFTSISTSSGVGIGSATSATCKTSGPPGRVNCTAFIHSFLLKKSDGTPIVSAASGIVCCFASDCNVVRCIWQGYLKVLLFLTRISAVSASCCAVWATRGGRACMLDRKQGDGNHRLVGFSSTLLMIRGSRRLHHVPFCVGNPRHVLLHFPS